MSRTARENILSKPVLQSSAKSQPKPAARTPGRTAAKPAAKPGAKPGAKPAGKPGGRVAPKSQLGATPQPVLTERSLATTVAASAKRGRIAGASPVAPSTRSRITAGASVGGAGLPVIESARSHAVKPVTAKSRASDAAQKVRVVSRSTASAAAATRASKAPAKALPLSERPIDLVWREYRVSPTEEVRNFLVGRHLDLVAYAAERLHKRLPSEVEINDLKSAGAFGLMDAVESFDPDRGVKFETYCTQRIRGAMFDELRSMDWVPRLVRSRTAKVEKVRKSIEMETGARPTEDEVAARLNVSGDEFEKLQKDSRPISMVSLTRKCFETDSSKDVREIDVVEDGRQENPLQVVQKQDLQALITKGLNRAERLIVILYYYEEMTMKEIGATLDLSESRVSQMHSSILARLKAQMQHRENTEE